jgi:hypothetical protein
MPEVMIDDPINSSHVSQFPKGSYGQLSLRIFGDLMIIQGPRYRTSIYADMEEVITLPVIILDHRGEQNQCLNFVYSHMSRQLHPFHGR